MKANDHGVSSRLSNDGVTSPPTWLNQMGHGFVSKLASLSLTERRDCLAVALTVLTLTLFWPVQTFNFVNYDDAAYIYENKHVAAGLSKENLIWAFTSLHGNISYWHPLTWISHQIDCQFFGLQAGAHHLTNLCLHTANTLLLFLLLFRMTAAIWQSGLVAALFALHPLHVESVAWVSERKDVLSAFFVFLTIGSYLNYAQSKRRSDYVKTLLFFCAGLMSKPMVVTLPVLLLLLDYWPLKRVGWTGQTAPATGFALVAQIFSLLSRRISFCNAPAVRGRWNLWTLCRLQIGDTADCKSALRALGATPRQRLFELFRLNGVLVEKIPFFCLSLALGVVTIIAQHYEGAMVPVGELQLSRRISNALITPWLYLGKALWPADLAVIYPHPGYWPLAVVVIFAGLHMLVLGVTIISARRAPYLIIGWLWYLVSLLPTVGLIQVGGQAMADRYTYVPLIGVFMGVVWLGASFAREISQFKLVIASAVVLYVVTLSAVTRFHLPVWTDSVALFRQALAVAPYNNIAHNNLAVGLIHAHRTNEALVQFEKFALQHPDDPLAWRGIGGILLAQGKPLDALSHFQRALAADPSCPQIHASLGEACMRVGDDVKAKRSLKKALAIDSKLIHAHFNLAQLLATHPRAEVRKPEEDLKHALELCKLTHYRSPSAIGLVAAAHAQLGRFDDAATFAEKGHKLAAEQGDKALANELLKQKSLYRAGKPFTDATLEAKAKASL